MGYSERLTTFEHYKEKNKKIKDKYKFSMGKLSKGFIGREDNQNLFKHI